MSNPSTLNATKLEPGDIVMSDASSSPFPSQPNEQQLLREAQLYHIYTERSFEEFEFEHGINIVEASQKNIAREREFLGNISPTEQKIIELIISNLTAKHKTHAFKEISKEGALLSVRERERLERAVKNSNTGRTAGDDDIFFTVGIGDHRTPAFLDRSGGHTFILSLNKLFKDYEHRFKGFYVSGHLTDYVKQTISRPSYFGETLFQYSHNDKEKTKTYTYTYPDGNKHTLTLTMGDEIFCGKEVLKGLALQFARHIRLIGGNYYQHICDTMHSENLQEIMRVLSTGMNLLMPGWVYPEGKLPGKLALDLPDAYLKIEHPPVQAQFGEHSSIDWDHQWHLKKKAFEEGDLELFRQLINNGRFKQDDIKESLFKLAGHPEYQNRARTAQFLIDHGADLTAIDINVEVLGEAVEKDDPEFIDVLFTLKSPDEYDPLISHKVNIQHAGCNLNELGIIGEACFGKKPAVLRRLIANGVDPLRDQRLLAFAADNSFGNSWKEGMQERNVETFKILLDHGVDIKVETKYGKTPLMHFILNGNIAGIIEAVNRGAPLNSQMQYVHISRVGAGPSFISPDNGFTALHFLLDSHQSVYDTKMKDNSDTRRYQLASFLLGKGADPNIASLSGLTPYQLAKQKGYNDITDLLIKYGAKTEDIRDKYDILCQHHQIGVVAVVKGLDSNGQEVVVMGKKLGKDGLLKQEYLFPGGLKDQGDLSLISAAVREFKEETFGNLEPLVESKQIIPQVIYQYDTLGEDKYGNRIYYKVAYVLFDIGQHLATMRLRARDDLHLLRLVPTASIQAIENQPLNKRNVTTVEEERIIPIRGSNGLVLEAIKNGQFANELTNALNEISNIELVGKDLFMAAVESNDITRVRYLLDHGARLEPAENFEEKVPLQYAAYLGFIDIVKLLIERGAKVNICGCIDKKNIKQEYDEACYGSLSAAILGNHQAIIDYLLPLTLAHRSADKTEEDNLEEIQLRLKDALSKAARVGNIKALSQILDTGLVGPDDHVESLPLALAAANGHQQAVNLLLSRGANINYCLQYDHETADPDSAVIHSPLIVAIEKHRTAVALELMRVTDIDINKHHTSLNLRFKNIIVNPLFAAIKFGEWQVADALIEETDIDLTKRNNNGEDCLTFAHIHPRMNIIADKIAQKLLLNKISNDLEIEPSTLNLSIRLDEHNKPSIHIMHPDKEAMEKLAKLTNATVRQEDFTKQYYVRLGEVLMHKYLPKNGIEIFDAMVEADKARLAAQYGRSSFTTRQLMV
ncbi:ankyrin repeat domain-containing protein [Rickettsiales endosymbiont of Stachyamoeba lipophora]|uniref:ankyrin repeat domain-containing protein n=1 Tax=Rickettsiales endosymbiont of Stachyamoeba lipophora TaxID=2486578 RepID=UPI000F64A36B|nr:ankyrin repeat domain-containing protein [Rickettsiales endosymbiont of Stachyamoeba lipophora]AZL15269.1 hypothetical protein EF513_01690 [Rickettsiales endosymbiont of Stachyamoeba lipophora]